MATEYRFKNSEGQEITTKSASAANEMRLRPGFSEVKSKPAAKSDNK